MICMAIAMTLADMPMPDLSNDAAQGIGSGKLAFSGTVAYGFCADKRAFFQELIHQNGH
jgi:hypothetical protein